MMMLLQVLSHDFLLVLVAKTFYRGKYIKVKLAKI